MNLPEDKKYKDRTLSDHLTICRADRPDEWKMDEFTKMAKELEHKLKSLSGVKNAYISGYEAGHNDTVESQYGDSEELAEEYIKGLSLSEEPKDKWQFVEAKLPESYGVYLIIWPLKSSGSFQIDTAYFNYDYKTQKKIWMCHGIQRYPTHWRVLPEPPKPFATPPEDTQECPECGDTGYDNPQAIDINDRTPCMYCNKAYRNSSGTGTKQEEG